MIIEPIIQGVVARSAHPAGCAAAVRQQIAYVEGCRTPGRGIGTAPKKAGILSFVMECAHPHDIGTILDRQGIAIRAGHHCAQPAMEALGLVATARASFGLYNTKEDVDALVTGLEKVRGIFG